MAQAPVQSFVGAHAQSGLTATVALTGITAGNHLRVSARVSSNGRSVSGVADNASGGSNTWLDTTEVPTDGGTNNKCVMWYAENVKSGNYTVTITWDSASATNVEVICEEWSGTATSSSLDVHASGGASVGASPLATITTGATTNANDNVYTVGMSVNASNARPLTTPAGYTQETSTTVNSQANQFMTAYKNVSATGTQSVSWAWTGGNSTAIGILVTFKDAAGGGGGSSGLSYLRRRKQDAA